MGDKNGSGSTAIDSVGNNNGILIGDPDWTTGRIDAALSFDGDEDYGAVDRGVDLWPT